MTQRSFLRFIAGIVQTAYRSLDAQPERPTFDTYGPQFRAPASFVHRLFLG